MFGSLKKKLQDAVGKFSKKVDEEVADVEEPIEEIKEPVEELKEEPEEEKEEEISEEPVEEVKEEEIPEEPEEESEEEVEKVKDKRGFLTKIREKVITKKISEKKFDELFWELEVILLENNVAVEVIEKIKSDLKEKLVDQPIPKREIQNKIVEGLRESIDEILSVEGFDLVEKSKEGKPYVIAFIGINGSGKTTTIAKVANMFKESGKSVVLAACDTFRAAAIEQLDDWAKKLEIPILKGKYGADAASIAFDAVKHAGAKGIDVVLIDTAGRLHSNADLMKELEKLIRVAKPDLKIFVGESITGNDCVEQAKEFDESTGIDAVILSKADVDDKGGAAISVGYVTGKPIIYLGNGQELKDLKKFDKDELIKTLGL